MENLVFTQLSISEMRQLFQQELQSFFASNILSSASTATDELLTIRQAADLLKLSVATIYGLVSRAQLPVNKRGKRLYFTKHELTEWVRAGRKKTIAEIQEEAKTFSHNQKKK
jgi:excisionase family DNA binding protein